MQIPYLDLRRSTADLAPQLTAAYERVLASGWFVLGPEVTSFEHEWARYCASSFCIGTGNALDGLEIALAALDLPPGGEVIVPSNTYIATWLAVTNSGLKVRPVEPDAQTYNLSAEGVGAALTPKTVAVLGVHLFGQLADEAICELAARAGVPIVFDAAQAHGAKNAHGGTSGNLGDIAVHSYYPTKNLGALGDGGAITTDHPEAAAAARLLRNYGSARKYENEVRGRNSRLDELQAAMLREMLVHLDANNERRRAIAEVYSSQFSNVGPIHTPQAPQDSGRHVWHVYNITCETAEHRERLSSHLSSLGVGTQIFYPVPPHMSAAYKDHGWSASEFPIAKELAETSLALPIAPYLSADEVEFVVDAVKSCA